MSGLTRRAVIRGGLAAAVVTGLSTLGALPAAARVGVGAIERSALEAVTGARVTLRHRAITRSARLVRVSDLRNARPGHPEAFALRFELLTPEPWAAEAGLVDVSMPDVTLAGVGLTTVGGASGRLLEAIIDRRSVAEHLRTNTRPSA